MKKEKGFTLIELLAVIVILAVIALIVTPMVMSTINSAREGAAKSSAGEFVHAIETRLAVQAMSAQDVANGVYTVANGDIAVTVNGAATTLTSIAQHVSTINGQIKVNGINVAEAHLNVVNGSNSYWFTLGTDGAFTATSATPTLTPSA